jgi:mannose-6-phosphate isomerase-like protein (cupin superfamily)
VSSDDAIVTLKENLDYPAPDTSEIRCLVIGDRGGFAHCVLPAGAVSVAVKHRSVEEIWFVLEGRGEIWRGIGSEGRIDPLAAGDSLRIPPDTAFQFRAAKEADLKILIATMPPWPGRQEAIPATGPFRSDRAVHS